MNGEASAIFAYAIAFLLFAGYGLRVWLASRKLPRAR